MMPLAAIANVNVRGDVFSGTAIYVVGAEIARIRQQTLWLAKDSFNLFRAGSTSYLSFRCWVIW